jgi:hypothetical protein
MRSSNFTNSHKSNNAKRVNDAELLSLLDEEQDELQTSIEGLDPGAPAPPVRLAAAGAIWPASVQYGGRKWISAASQQWADDFGAKFPNLKYCRGYVSTRGDEKLLLACGPIDPAPRLQREIACIERAENFCIRTVRNDGLVLMTITEMRDGQLKNRMYRGRDGKLIMSLDVAD